MSFQPKIKNNTILTINGEKQLEWKNIISPSSPNTLHTPGVEDSFDELPRMAHFVGMIAWVWESLIGHEIPYSCHNFYLEEAIGQQEGFHLHLPPFHDVSPLVLHAWEGVLEDRFIANCFEQWWELLMRRPKDEEGRNFSLLIQFLEEKQHFGGDGYNIPKF